MLRRVSLAIATILFLSSGAFAGYGDILAGSIDQYQGFTIGDTMCSGLSTSLNLVHGDIYGSSLQHVWVENTNVAGTPCGHGSCSHGIDRHQCGDQCGSTGCAPAADQSQIADICQEAEARGCCGVISVNEFLDASGTQSQFIGSGTEMKDQFQTVGLTADQILFRSDGAGSGEATHHVWLNEEQNGVNSAGAVHETSTVDACQESSVNGAANSTATLVNSLTVDTLQWQTTY
jgi:hypothetical protein